MAWKYMKRPIKGEYVADIDALNENFLVIAEESAGYLNEHNLEGPGLDAAGTELRVSEIEQLVSTRTGLSTPSIGGVIRSNKLPEDIAYRLHYTVPSKSRKPNDVAASNWTDYAANDFFVTKAVPGFSMRRTFVGGVVWICCSFTLHSHNAPAFDDLTEFRADAAEKKGFGFNIAIEIDGAIVPESLVGTGDITQENFMDQNQTKIGGSGSDAGGLNTKPKGGGGVNGARNAIVVDAVVPLSPGVHTIRLAIQDIRGSNARISNNKVKVSTIEFFALEMLG